MISSKEEKSKPQIISLPSIFPDSFDPSQSQRGNTTWQTLFSSELAAGIASCPPGSKSNCPSTPGTGQPGHLAAHKHVQPELYHILSGKGIVEIEEVKYDVKKGMTIFIPGDAEHAVFNPGVEELRWLYVFPGPFEDVAYRFRHEGAYEKAKL